MTDQSPTIWIDVTTLCQWSGEKTGIPRVEERLSTLMRARYPDTVRLCQFQEKTQSFIDVTDLLKKNAAPVTPKTPSPLSHFWYYMKAAVRSIIRAAFRSLPYSMKLGLRRAWIHLAIRKWCSPFIEHDFLLIVGSAWSLEGYNQAIVKIKKKTGVRLVQIIHDLIACRFPHFFYSEFSTHFKQWMQHALWNMDYIFAISNNTAQDIAWFSEMTDIPLPPIQVIRLGDTLPFTESTPLPTLIGKRFVLTVGTIEIRKNHDLLYKVWHLLRETLPEEHIPELVIVGRKAWLTSDFLLKLERDSFAKRKIHLLHATTDSELAWLYRHCLFTLYPSYYEGWGLPVAESLAYGKYCIASSTSSLPEVGGNFAEYASPWDPIEWKNAIFDMLQNPTLLKRREEYILSNYRSHTWEACVEEIFSSLHKM